MDAKRLYDICIRLKKLKDTGKTTIYLESLAQELKISWKEIKETKINSVFSEVNKQSKKSIQTATAVRLKLRIVAYELGKEKGILKIGDPLPKIGSWKSGTLLGLSKNNMLQFPKPEIGRNWYDPIENIEFIKLLSKN